MKKRIFYFLIVLLIYFPILSGYRGPALYNGDEVWHHGRRLNDTQKDQIELAMSNLTFAAVKLWGHGYLSIGGFTNLVNVASSIKKLLKSGNINEEISVEANNKFTATTLRDSSEEAKNDKINVNSEYLQPGIRVKYELAGILAHEGEHARQMHFDKDFQEIFAYFKESTAIIALISYAKQEILDPTDQAFVVNKLSDHYFRDQKTLGEHIKNWHRKLKRVRSSEFSRPVEPENVAIKLNLDEIVVLIVSSDPFTRIWHDILGQWQIRFQRIQKPLSGARLKIKGEDLLIISGTAFNDSIGIIEAFRFIRRATEDGRELITGIDPRSQIIFQKENIWPASVTIDGRNDNIYILDSLEHRILLLKDGSLREIANAKKFKELKEVKSLGFGTLAGFIEFPTLGGSTIPYGVDSFSQSDKQFVFIDNNNDFIIDDIKTFTVRELTSFKPDFHIEPFAGEGEVFIWATFNSHVKVITQTGALLGEIKRVPFELPAEIKLARKLQQGEVVKLTDLTTSAESLPHTVEAPKPTVIAIFPAIGQEMRFPTVVILGKYLAPDSRVFVLGFPGDTLVVRDNLIIARIPTFRRIEQFNPVAAQVEIRSLQTGSTFVDFNYYNKDDYLAILKDVRGAMFKKRKMIMQIMKAIREDPEHSSNIVQDKVKLQYIE